MERKELFEHIQKLLPLINQYYKTRSIKLTADETSLIKLVWEKGIMRTTLQTSCATCITYAMDVIYSFNEREYPKYLRSIDPEPIETIVEEIQEEFAKKEMEEQKKQDKKRKPAPRKKS